MIPVITTKKDFVEARNGYVLCHPANDQKTMQRDEKVIEHGSINMLSTPISCGKRALITKINVICAIDDTGTVLINPNGQMIPDAADCINEFLEDNGFSFSINKYQWTINGQAVVAKDAMYNSNGTPVNELLSRETGATAKGDKKMVGYYVDNVMDAVENKFPGDKKSTMWGFFAAAQDQHSGINYAPSFDTFERARDTLYTLVFNLEMVSKMQQDQGVKECKLDVDETVLKKSTAKRLLLAYVSSKVGVPYVPIGIKELKKEVGAR